MLAYSGVDCFCNRHDHIVLNSLCISLTCPSREYARSGVSLSMYPSGVLHSEFLSKVLGIGMPGVA